MGESISNQQRTEQKIAAVQTIINAGCTAAKKSVIF
jgi:hypothetical protein